MPTIRTASFWIAALVLPGGFLLLAPKVMKVARKAWLSRRGELV